MRAYTPLCALLTACSAVDYSGTIALALDPGLGPSAQLVAEARLVWEERVGQKLFDDGPGVVVEPMSNCYVEGNWRLGQTDKGWTIAPNSMSGSVKLCVEALETSSHDYALGAVVHELGHLLRLEHVKDASNVMNAQAHEDWTIADWQAETVRETTH